MLIGVADPLLDLLPTGWVHRQWGGMIVVSLVEHIPHLRSLQHLRKVSLNLLDSGPVDDLAFLRDAPPVTTWFQVKVSGPVDLASLASCPALTFVNVLGGNVSAGLEILDSGHAILLVGGHRISRSADS